MKPIYFVLLLCTAGAISSAAEVKAAGEKKGERISQESLLKSDRMFHDSAANPCGLDKYKYFCCPVRKIVRRKAAEGKWTDYCYNERDELIGIRKGDHRGSVKRSDFSAVTGCSRCGNREIKQHSWKFNTNPRLAPPKKKKNR